MKLGTKCKATRILKLKEQCKTRNCSMIQYFIYVKPNENVSFIFIQTALFFVLAYVIKVSFVSLAFYLRIADGGLTLFVLRFSFILS